jgi:hypothetical protein
MINHVKTVLFRLLGSLDSKQKSRKMKYLVICFVLIILYSCDCQKENVLSVNAKLLRTYDTIYDIPPVKKAFDIKLTLRNNTRKPVTFWIMLCSWQENFLLNTYDIKYGGIDCPKNFPVKRTIPPSDSLIYKMMVLRDSVFFNPIVRETRFGFIFVDTVVCKNYSEFDTFLMDRSKQTKIFWSNPLELYIPF